MEWFVGLTCAFTCFSIWIRRSTLYHISDREKLTHRTATAALLMQILGLILMSPWSSATVGHWLHAVTGLWNLNAWVGHGCFLGAAGFIGLYVGSRLTMSDAELHAAFRVCFERPITIVMPVLLALLAASSTADGQVLDLYDAPTDPWLDCYWTLVCAFGIVLNILILRALRLIRRDKRSQRTADIYAAACIVAIAVSMLRIVTTWHDIDHVRRHLWALDCAVVALNAYGAGRAWLLRPARRL